MRLLLSLFLAISMVPARAVESVETCAPPHCQEERTATHDIGRGATITLPDGWTYFSYPSPLPEMAGLKEVRAFNGAVVIAISPVPNVDRRRFSEGQVRDLLAQGVAPYVPFSKEQAAKVLTFSRDGLVGGSVSFTAANLGATPFTVLPKRRFASVTSFLVSYKAVLFSISVASELEPEDDYRAAIDAIRNMR
jgi:hypothetical protein